MNLLGLLFVLLSVTGGILPGLVKLSDLHPQLDEHLGVQRKVIGANFNNHYLPYVEKLLQQKLPVDAHQVFKAIGFIEVAAAVLSLFSSFFTLILIAILIGAIALHSQTDGIEFAIPAIVILVVHLLRLYFNSGKKSTSEKTKSGAKNTKKNK